MCERSTQAFFSFEISAVYPVKLSLQNGDALLRAEPVSKLLSILLDSLPLRQSLQKFADSHYKHKFDINN